jgi:hypothetical protein
LGPPVTHVAHVPHTDPPLPEQSTEPWQGIRD